MTPLEKAFNSKKFCILPWVHQYVGPPGDIKPCCLFLQDHQIGDFKKESLAEAWNNATTKQLRLDLLNGVEVEGCKKCNSREDLTINHREMFNKFLFSKENYNLVDSTGEDGHLEQHQLQYIDVRFNNLCNLRCRTCGPRFSTSWIDDHTKLYNIKNEDRAQHGDVFQFPGQTEDQLLKEILPHLPYIKQIYFAGGEPLMQKEHYAILDELISIGKVNDTELRIFYNTNFSVLKLGKHNALTYWKQFKNVRISASIDGSYTRAEYWRKGTNWNQVVRNVQELKKECPQVEFAINYTLSWVNAFNLPELHKEWVENDLLKINNLNVNLLDVPTYYSLKSIPLWKKDKIKDIIESHILWLESKNARIETVNGFKNAITFMYSSDTDDELKEFFNTNGKLDKLRNEDFWSVYPEHHDMKNLYV